MHTAPASQSPFVTPCSTRASHTWHGPRRPTTSTRDEGTGQTVGHQQTGGSLRFWWTYLYRIASCSSVAAVRLGKRLEIWSDRSHSQLPAGGSFPSNDSMTTLNQQFWAPLCDPGLLCCQVCPLTLTTEPPWRVAGLRALTPRLFDAVSATPSEAFL